MAGGADQGGIGRALLHPAALALAALTVGAALISPLLAVPGAVAWGVTVYVLARRGAARRGPMVDMTALPPTIQRDVFEVRQALADIRAISASASRDRQIMLEDVLREAQDVDGAVLQMAVAAGRLHDHLAASVAQVTDPDRQRMMEMLQRYRTNMDELVASAHKLRSNVQLLAAGQLVDYDSEHAPARQMDEMKASVAALEEVISTSTMLQ